MEDNVIPSMAALRELLEPLSDAEARDLVLKYPQVLSLSASANIAPTLTALRELLGESEGEGSRDAVAAAVRTIVMRLPSVLGLNVERNLRPKLAFLSEGLGLSGESLRVALLREPAVLGASLESMRTNLVLWREALADDIDLREVARVRGLRWLTSSSEKRTRPRLQRAAADGVPAHALLTKMRLTDQTFEQWLATRARTRTPPMATRKNKVQTDDHTSSRQAGIPVPVLLPDDDHDHGPSDFFPSGNIERDDQGL